PIGKIVQHTHLVAARQQAFAKMAADEPGPACHQQLAHGASLNRSRKKERSCAVLMPRASVASSTSNGVTVQPCADRKGRKGRKLTSPVWPPRAALIRYPSQAAARACVPSRNVPTSEKPLGVVGSPSRLCRTLARPGPSKTYST